MGSQVNNIRNFVGIKTFEDYREGERYVDSLRFIPLSKLKVGGHYVLFEYVPRPSSDKYHKLCDYLVTLIVLPKNLHLGHEDLIFYLEEDIAFKFVTIKKGEFFKFSTIDFRQGVCGCRYAV